MGKEGTNGVRMYGSLIGKLVILLMLQYFMDIYR